MEVLVVELARGLGLGGRSRPARSVRTSRPIEHHSLETSTFGIGEDTVHLARQDGKPVLVAVGAPRPQRSRDAALRPPPRSALRLPSERCRAADETELDAAMTRYARGDQSAFRTLHRALHPRVFAYFVCQSRSREAAGDLTQETWLRIHRGRSTFARGSAALPWVYAIARNVHRDHLRSMRIRADKLVSGDSSPEPADLGGPDAEAEAIAAQTADVVERVLAGLPASQREAYVLLRREGLRVEEAAAALGTTATAVKLRAFRACEALRTEIELSSPKRGQRRSSPRERGHLPGCS
jgi:RNA polymerase sigma-70 factor (ECF subfamily)